jgi:hypothetical protein
MMQADAKVCGFCSYDFLRNQPARPTKNGRLGCLAIVALVVLAVLILGGIRSIVDDGSPEQEASA